MFDFLLTFHSDNGPILYLFSRYNEILAEYCEFFLSLVYLMHSSEGFPLKLRNTR